jgi:hypothetical protein
VHVPILEWRMTDSLRTSSSPLKIFLSQRTVDSECRTRSFSRGNDGQLDIFDDVASGEHAGDAGRLVRSTFYFAVPIELAADRFCQFGLATRRCIEE